MTKTVKYTIWASLVIVASYALGALVQLETSPGAHSSIVPFKDKNMTPERLERKFSENQLGFVIFQYQEVPPEKLPAGPRAAMASSRVWQEQIMQEPFQVPPHAVQKVHDRKQGQPDAVSFEYETAGFSVRSFHLMDRLAIVLTPLSDRTEFSEGHGRSIEALASRLATLVFQPGGKIDLVVEESGSGVKFGRNRKSPGKAPDQESPTDLIVWWYQGGSFGFATEKVTVLEEGNVPSTAGLSPQQVYMWFDTYGGKRYR